MWEAENRSRPLRAGLIGGGFIAGVHARAIRAAGGHVHAVASSSPERARTAATELGAGLARSSVRELLADESVDVVHVCSPHGTHAGYAHAALEAGKHVVCEKPLAVAADEAARLTALAAERGLVATVPFVYRYHPMVVEARSRVAAGALGPLVGMRGAYLQEWRLAYSEDGWWTDPEATGPSRAFGDIGSHLGDLLTFVGGQDVVRVSAATRTVLPESPGGRPLRTEDIAALTVETSGGAIGSLMVSQMTLGRKNHLTLEVFGLDGSLAFEQESPETLWYADRSGLRPVQRDAPALSPAAARLSVLPGGHPMGYQDAFDAFVKDTYAAVRGADPEELPRFRDGLRAALLTEAVVASAATGTWADVRRTADRPLEGVRHA
ncbi:MULTISPECIES: Gfo/Idh/MocA family protein [unclassified Streptomyces]|uniref:Gfo/Idh/MocA family protein n=1 Tax=unclassified Streptomyces TaxID=2593676 RepID=UPI0036E14CEF